YLPPPDLQPFPTRRSSDLELDALFKLALRGRVGVERGPVEVRADRELREIVCGSGADSNSDPSWSSGRRRWRWRVRALHDVPQAWDSRHSHRAGRVYAGAKARLLQVI